MNRRRQAPSLSPQELKKAGALGASFLNDYFEHCELKVSAHYEGAPQGELVFQLQGEVRPLRRDPEGLSALTRLTQMALSSERLNAPCVLDIEGSARARTELLKTMTEDLIDVVKHTQRRAVIEGLSSQECRKVHTVVSEDGELETESKGEGEFRYLMVSPRS